MRIGYACLTVGVPGTKIRSCTLKNADPDRLISVIRSNLTALDHMLEYNIKNEIKLFRMSSDIIPFGSHSVNTLDWSEMFRDELLDLGRKATSHGMRLSMHPGQYTVLNSPDEGVVHRAVEELRYHALLMDTMGLDQTHKMILHVGGVYGDKSSAIERFIREYRKLDEGIRKRLVIENDDRQFNIGDVLEVSLIEGIPVVFDNLHHQVNSDPTHTLNEWIRLCTSTWEEKDGPQKMHYSQQDIGKRSGSHSSTIDLDQFLSFYESLENAPMDIMLEVKDKNLSAVKCVNALAGPKIRSLEEEWGRYKYLVLEHSQSSYQAIRQLLKDKSAYPVQEFYRLVDEALAMPAVPGGVVNAAQHVWGYFKNSAEAKERSRVAAEFEKIAGGASAQPLKRLLYRLALEKQQKYLLDSLYFIEQIQ